MRVRVLGCSGGIGGEHRSTALLVDDDILIDCGTGVGELPLDALLRIDHVFLTHTHLDHIALLPMLLDTVAEQRRSPVTVHASAASLRVLREHVFNWHIWPDFTVLPTPDQALLRLQVLEVGERVQLGERELLALPARHSVPAQGYCLSCGGEALAFTGDTALCEALTQALNGVQGLRHLLVEVAYPDALAQRAQAAGHLCPAGLAQLLAALEVRPEVLVTHLKPAQAAQIVHELSALPVRILQREQVFMLPA